MEFRRVLFRSRRAQPPVRDARSARQARVPRADVLHAGARGAGRTAVPDHQGPDHGQRCGEAARRAAVPQRVWRCAPIQGAGRPPHDPNRQFPPTDQSGRAASAGQCAAWRDVAGGPSSAVAVGSRLVRGAPLCAVRRQAGYDGAMAGQRPQPGDRLRAGDRPRDPVHSRVVARQRSQHSVAHRVGGSPNARSALRALRSLRRATCCLPWLSMTFASTTTGQKAAERWVLIYAGGPKRPAYSVEDLTHLLAVVDTAGKPTGWLCSGTIFLEFRAVSGRFYMPSGNAPPSSGEDWTAYLDSVFAPGGPIARLDAAAGAIDHAVGRVGRRVDVAVMIPYPDPRGTTLSLGGRTYKMTVDSGRLDLVTAYLPETQRRFAGQRLADESAEHTPELQSQANLLCR